MQDEYVKKLSKGHTDLSEPVPPGPINDNERFLITGGSCEGLRDTVGDSEAIGISSSEAGTYLGLVGGYKEGKAGKARDGAVLRGYLVGEGSEDVLSGGRVRSTNGAPFVSVDLDTQPGTLHTLFSEADHLTGLTARFLIHEPPSFAGKRTYEDYELDDEAFNTVVGVVESLFETQGEPDDEQHRTPKPLRLTGEAQESYRSWRAHNEKRIDACGDPALQGFLNHLRGHHLILCGLLQLMEDPRAAEINATAVERASLMTDYFLPHRRRVFHIDQRDETEQADRLVAWGRKQLTAGKDVTLPEVRRHLRLYRDHPGGWTAGKAAAVRHLRSRGWRPHSPEREKETTSGRPPAPIWRPREGGPRGPQRLLESATLDSQTRSGGPSEGLGGKSGNSLRPPGDAARESHPSFFAILRFLREELFPATYDRLEVLPGLSGFGWMAKSDAKGSYKQATNRERTKGQLGARPDRVIIRRGESGVLVHGDRSVSLLSLFSGCPDQVLRGSEFFAAVRELADAVGLAMPRTNSGTEGMESA